VPEANFDAAKDDAARNMVDQERITALMTQRYRENGGVAPRSGHPAIETMLNHRTVRSYLPDAVEAEAVSCAIAAAQSAPSSSNLQLWSVITVTDPARKARLADLCNNQKHIYAAPLLMVWVVDLARLRRITEIEAHSADGLEYLELFLTGSVDVTLAAQNAVVTLESLGYGTCYIGSMRSNPLEVSAELGLPPGMFAIFGLTVGREDPERPASVKPRLAQRAVHHTETFDGSQTAENVASYNAVMRTFQQEQGMPLVDWSIKSSERVANASALKNRDKLRGYLEQLGFAFK